MAETDSRLRRRIAAEIGDCGDDDVARRLDELDALVDVGESRDWNLDDRDGKSPAGAAAIRDEVERRVGDLLDELAGEA